MDHIYIDTSLFERSNFLNGSEIKEILKLSEQEQVKILMPYITYKEIINRFQINLSDAISKHNKLINPARVLRNFHELAHVIEKLNEDELLKSFITSFDKVIVDSKIIIIEYLELNIGTVFEKYFQKTYPFSPEKKHEFPDAFILLSLEKWCADNRKKCLVFSGDKDMNNYESKYLKVDNNLKGYTNEILRNLEIKANQRIRLDKVQEIYILRSDQLKSEIKEIIEKDFYDSPEDFIEKREVNNEFEYYDHYISDIDIWLGNYQLVSITDRDIVIEAKAEARYNVSMTYDDDSQAYYNSYTDDWDDLKEESVEISANKQLSVQFNIIIPVSGNLEHLDIYLYDLDYF